MGGGFSPHTHILRSDPGSINTTIQVESDVQNKNESAFDSPGIHKTIRLCCQQVDPRDQGNHLSDMILRIWRLMHWLQKVGLMRWLHMYYKWPIPILCGKWQWKGGSDQWATMGEERESLHEKHMWKVVKLLERHWAIGCKWEWNKFPRKDDHVCRLK